MPVLFPGSRASGYQRQQLAACGAYSRGCLPPPALRLAWRLPTATSQPPNWQKAAKTQLSFLRSAVLQEEEEEAKPAAKKKQKGADGGAVDVSGVNGSRTIFIKNLAWAADEVRMRWWGCCLRWCC